MSVSSPEDLSDAIAVIGMSCNFPGASSCEQYWQNLQKGVESTTRFTREELLAAGVPESLVDDPRYVPVNGVINDVELFDADYFGLTPKEASITDPQHRVFLECAHQALENAGYDSNRYAGEIAVYAGTGPSSYLLQNLFNNPDVKNSSDFQLFIGNTQDFLSTRVGYRLNLTGPCITVGTACSTSLVAIHMACQALLDFQSDMALVGGVSLQLPQTRGYLFEEGGILSPDGSCRAFDQASAGTVNGNGAGVVLLKRYEDAITDGDKIRAIVRGSAINNDGAAKVGFTAPSVDGQIKVVAEALQSAGLEADDIDYIETHGTATALGDSIEIKALKSVFETQSSRKNFCALGSVKTNLGHLDAAAGIAGFIKTVLALEHQQIPASLHFDVANPSLKLEQSPFYVNAALQPWQGEEKTRFAGISSFGIGGTNAHVILQEAPVLESFADQSEENRYELVVLSAKSESALNGMMQSIQHYLSAPLGQPVIGGRPESGGTDNLKNIAFTLAKGRTEHRHRKAWTASSAGDLLDQLVRTTDSAPLADKKPLTAPKVVFMFPGQGSQSVGMAAGLYRFEPVFKHLVDECLQQLKPPFFERVKGLLLNEVKQESHSGGSDNHTQWVQPALFILEYALAKLWMHKGVTPDLLIGHSIGEYVASCISGVLKLEDAIELVCKRAELMQSAPSGSMLAVPLPEAEIACFLNDKVSLAAVNTLSQCVLSGETEALAIIADKIPGSIKLNTSHGFHSQLMDPVLADFGAVSRGLKLHELSIPYVSNLTGDYITAEDLSSGSYWQEHLRSTVRFAASIETFLTDNTSVCIELGVGKVLSRMVSSIEKQSRSELKPAVKIEGLRLGESPEDIDGYLLNRLGMAWAAGINLDWDTFYVDRSEQFQRIELPTYAYDRQRHWIDSPAYKNLSRESTSLAAGPLESGYEERLPFDDWFQTPTWVKVVGLEVHRSEANWLLINSDKSRGGLVDYLQGKLNDGNSRVEKIDGLAELDSCITEMDLSANELPLQVVYWLKRSAENPYEDYFNIVTLANTLSELNRHASIVLLSPVFFQVLSDEDSHVNSALALGIAKVITQEYPHLVCRLIDSDVNEGDSRQGNVSLLKALLYSYTCSVDSLLPTTPLAIRNGCIWKQQYQTLPSGGITGSPLTHNGVYLITGGLGGVGMILADYLAEHYQAKLLLLGRSKIDLSAAIDTRQRILKRIEQMEDKGAEVIALSADVGSDDDIEGVATLIESKFGKLDGIIHAAGITQREFIFNLLDESTESVAEDVFYPKVSGTLALESLANRFNPAFCLLISSNAATLGGIGMGAYSAASCWLDGYAQAKKTRVSDYPSATDDGLEKNSVRWISSNWDGWPTEETAGLESDFKTSIDRYQMTVSESERAFETVLASGVSQVVVSAGRLDDRLRQLEGLFNINNPKSANLNRELQASDLTLSPDQSAAQEAAISWHSDTECYVASVWSELLGVKHVTPNDDFFDLHGDSLMGTQLIARISKDKNIKIPFRMLFEKTQLREFALGVEDLCGELRDGQTEPASSTSNDNIIDDCGDEEGTI